MNGFGPRSGRRSTGMDSMRLKLIAIERCQGRRFRHAKRYVADSAVADLATGPGVATARIYGERSTPYEVTVSVLPGEGAPDSNEVVAVCDCDDRSDDPVELCAHAAAVVLALAAEAEVDPDLIERWRSDGASNRRRPDIVGTGRPVSRHGQEPDEPGGDEPGDHGLAEAISIMVAAPGGVRVGELERPSSLSVSHPVGDRIAELLASANDHLCRHLERDDA